MKGLKNLEEKIDHVLFNVICDIEPIHMEKMRLQLLSEDLRINDLIKKARKLLIPTEQRPVGRYYWVARGWPLSVAQAKIMEHRRGKKRKISPFSIDFWLTRINPNTGANFTEAEAEFKRNSLRPIRPEYWIVRHHSKKEAEELARLTKAKNNKLGADKVKARNKTELKSFSRRCIEYWVARGYTEIEARDAVKLTQSTFSLQECINKYGENEGINVWQKRQSQWQKNPK